MLFYDCIDSMIEQEDPVITEVEDNYQGRGIKALRIRGIENFENWELGVIRETRTIGVDLYKLYGEKNEKRDIERHVSVSGTNKELGHITHLTRLLEETGL